MFSFTTRSQVFGFIYSPIPLLQQQTRLDKIQNYEKYCIVQMENTYCRLMFDSIFINSIDYYTEKMTEKNNLVTQEKLRLAAMKKDYYRHLRQSTTPPLMIQGDAAENASFNYGLDFLKMRMTEQEVLVCNLLYEMKNFETNLFAFLYRPLIYCIHRIVDYCNHDEICSKKYIGFFSYQGERQIDLSNILKTILLHSNVTILEKEKYSKNVYYFPLIARMEDHCARALINTTGPGVAANSLMSSSFKQYFHILDERYLLIVCHKIAHLVANNAHKISKPTYTIWRLDGIGKIIFSYLLSDSLVEGILDKYGPETVKGKRKFDLAR